jgi:hypothetical protein
MRPRTEPLELRTTRAGTEILRAPRYTTFSEDLLDEWRKASPAHPFPPVTIKGDVVTIHGLGRQVCYELCVQSRDERIAREVRGERVWDDWDGGTLG